MSSESIRRPGRQAFWLLLLGLLLLTWLWPGLPQVVRLVQAPNTWHLTRTFGMMAYLLLWLSTVAGLLLSTRLLGLAAPPPLLSVTHQWAAAWSLYATTVHMVILLYDKWMPFGLTALLLPFAAPYRTGAMALGVYAVYAMIGVQLTSYWRSHLGTPMWRLVHMLSLAAFLLALVHGVAAGSDTGQPWAITLYGSTAGVFLFLFAARLLGAGRTPAAAPTRRQAGH